MCRSIQSVLLVVCVVTLSHHIQLGISQFDVNKILLRAWLISSLSDIKSNLSSIQTTVNTLEETVNTLTKEFDQFTSETASHFAEIENLVNQSDTQLMEIEELICDIHGVCTCGGTGGWRRVVYLDMTDPNTDCPPGWSMTNYDIRTCGRASDGYDTFDSVYYPVSGGEYSQVCGKMKAYQWGSTSGFLGYSEISRTTNISGVTVLHSYRNSRKHIWSFVNGGIKNYDNNGAYKAICPCDTQISDIKVPPFVGNDYFCDSGLSWPDGEVPKQREIYTLHSDDPLWDGDGCHSISTCCTFNNPPYFTKYLDNPTTDDIELQLCCYAPSYTENVAIEHVEIYVK